MSWGLNNRLSRIIRPSSGRTMMLAIDHGYFMGPTTGLEQPWEAVKDLVPHADALMLTRGVLRNCVPTDVDVPIVLRVSGGTSILSDELLHEGVTVSIEDAIRLNVSAIAYSIMVGAKFERDTILDFSRMVDLGETYGIPVLAVTAVGKEMVRDARYMGLASRIAAEHGAHIVKTYFVEGFEKVVEDCPVPIVIAGGKKVPERDALKTAAAALEAGAVGVDMGRNIFQSDAPPAMAAAVASIVHESRSPEEAYEIYQNNGGAKSSST